jgi:hypothetical protein
MNDFQVKKVGIKSLIAEAVTMTTRSDERRGLTISYFMSVRFMDEPNGTFVIPEQKAFIFI